MYADAAAAVLYSALCLPGTVAHGHHSSSTVRTCSEHMPGAVNHPFVTHSRYESPLLHKLPPIGVNSERSRDRAEGGRLIDLTRVSVLVLHYFTAAFLPSKKFLSPI